MPAARRYRRFGDLLASREIDAVIVATPDHWHAPIASAAARAGKHVYLEKCFTHKVPETFELAKAVKETKVVLQLGHQRRSGALYTRAREVMKQGILGDVTLVQVFSNRNSPNGARLKRRLAILRAHRVESVKARDSNASSCADSGGRRKRSGRRIERYNISDE